MDFLFSFLHDDRTLKGAAALATVAAFLVSILPHNTIAYRIAVFVLGSAASLGVYSSTGREPKAGQ